MEDVRQDELVANFFGPDGGGPTLLPSRRTAMARGNGPLSVGNMNTPLEAPRKSAFSIDIERTSLMSTSGIDPITLTTMVLEAVNPVVNTLRSCQKQAERYKMAALSIASLYIECSAILIGLQRIKTLMSRDGEKALRTESGMVIAEDYHGVLEFSWLLSNVIIRHLTKLRLTHLEEMSQDEFTVNLEQLWNYREMDGIVQVLSRQARAVDLFYVAFKAETEQEMTTIMRSPEAKQVITSISGDTVSLHESFYTAPEGEVDAERASIIEDNVFEFDQILQSTALYRRASAWHSSKPQQNPIREKMSLGERSQPNVDSSLEAQITDPYPTIHLQALREKAGKVPHNQDTDIIRTLERQPGQSPILEKSPVPDNISAIPAVLQHADEEPADKPLDAMLEEYSRMSIDSDSSTDTITKAAKPPTNGAVVSQSTNSKVDTTENAGFHNHHDSLSLIDTENAGFRNHRSGLSLMYTVDDLPYRGAKRLPTLLEVLSRRTTKPYTLFEFYIYMRDVQRSVDYLDFWLDIVQHTSLCQHYVRELRRDIFSDDAETPPPSPDEDGESPSRSSSVSKTSHTVARQDLRASVEKILYTFVMPGCERELTLPGNITDEIYSAIVESHRDDPEVFSVAKDYVFQAMERDAFPGFLNLSRPAFRLFRRSARLGSLVNRLAGASPRYPRYD